MRNWSFLPQRVRACRALLGALVLSGLIFVAAAVVRPVYAGGVVGSGTPASCTDAALTTALAGGGAVTFNCGPNPATILLTNQKSIAAPTTRYYLEIVPAAGTDLNQDYDLVVDTQTAVTQTGFKAYLPLLWKQCSYGPTTGLRRLGDATPSYSLWEGLSW